MIKVWYNNLMKEIILWEKLHIHISDEDYDFLCEKRFSDGFSYDEFVSEFVSGTGITEKKVHLWPEADKRFAEYIQDLRDIEKMDINSMAQSILTEEEKFG